MALQIESVELLETSFQEVAPECGAFVTTFYEMLCTEFSQTKASKMKAQQKKLLEALSLVIQKLRDPDALADALKGLGEQHEVYGIRPEYYPIVGAVLLDTFALFLGDHWNPTTRNAWALTYQAICSLMEGAKIQALV